MIGALVGVLLAVVATTAVAAQSLLVRVSTKKFAVVDVIAVMFLVNLLVLLPVTVVWYYPAFGLTPTALLAFAIAGLLGSLLARLCLFVGIARLGASRAEPLKSTFPLVAVVGAVVVLNEQLTLALLAGTTLLIGGAIAVSWESHRSPATATGRRVWLDIGFPLAGALFLGIDPVFTKIGFAEGTPALVAVTVRVLAATAGFGLYLLWHRLGSGRQLSIRPNRWLVLAGVVNTVYLVSYLAALARIPVSVVTPILGASPLLVLVGAAIFIQHEERVTARLALAVVVVVVGVVLVLSG